MNATRLARLAVVGFAIATLPITGAHAQDCVEVAPGSSVGQPEQCEVGNETEVRGIQEEREVRPAPEPEAAPTLAATGASSGELALTGAAALGAGGALVLSVRRRRVEA